MGRNSPWPQEHQISCWVHILLYGGCFEGNVWYDDDGGCRGDWRLGLYARLFACGKVGGSEGKHAGRAA